MSKRRQHFVPKFYLRSFRSRKKRIHVFNLKRELAIDDASLKHQCYKRRFYGPDERLEDSLGDLEDVLAPAIRQIWKTGKLPPKPSEDLALVLIFVAIQSVRTESAGRRINELTDRLSKWFFAKDDRLDGIDLDDYRIGYDDPVLLSLSLFPTIAEAIDDLRLHLICSPPDRPFVTSDNPVVHYNQYCEGVRHTGVCGAANRGLQIFVPLSPGYTLLLYDPWVYKVGSKNSDYSTGILRRDADWLNRLQAVFATNNLYYHDWELSDVVTNYGKDVRRMRRQSKLRSEEFKEVRNPSDESQGYLMQTYEEMPNLRSDLSFVSLRRKARKVKLQDRAHMFRRDLNALSNQDELESPKGRGRTQRFVRMEGDQ